MELSASSRGGVRAAIIACEACEAKERLYRVAMTSEKSGPTSMIFPWSRPALCQVRVDAVEKGF